MDLFCPIEINGVRFNNRAVMAPVVLNCAGADGSVTPEFSDFYEARAMGGVGYIVLGATFVHPDGRGFGHQLGIDRDELLPGLSSLASVVRQHTRLGVQLSFKSIGFPPESFALADIRKYRRAFVQAAIRAREAGFDAVELHACHDYWLNYFLSPYFNRRTDEYGNGLDGRFRLLGETLREVLDAVGRDLVVGVRLSMVDFIDGGLGLGETLEIGRRLEAIGADYLSASAGIGITQYRMSPPSDIPRGSLLVYGRALQQAVSIPVIGVGRLDRPAEFREAVEGGHVRMAAAARAFIADPEFAAKIETGREVEIRPCQACNGCLTGLRQGTALRCGVNPYVGRDLANLKPLSRPRRVLVVGGGPAGLTAAAAAAGRGARVRLIERRPELGGALHVAGRPPFKSPLSDLARYLESEARSAGVDIDLAQEFRPELLTEDTPDEVIVATGALPWVPDCVPRGDERVVTAESILRRDGIAPGRYLVIGGGLVGLETAEYLAGHGAGVTVAEMLDTVGSGLGPMRLKLLLERLSRAGVNILTGARVTSVQDGHVRLDMGGGEIALGPYRLVVLAAGYRPDPVSTQAAGAGVTVRVIGDARTPRSIREAITEGLDAAMAMED
jgi:2,4-dienoyl-CoA reductase-like NADH-dependent reductase (Old Yellow Enzyme family)/thioredoxin reductase